MGSPADLAAHYSSKAFETRIYALTFAGAAVGATLVWLENPAKSNILGTALLAVVASLAELNRRFTYSYLCACVAASLSADDVQRWGYFRRMNEGPWSDRRDVKPKPAPDRISRFFLMWATYLPGLIAAACLQYPAGVPCPFRAVVLALCLALLWWWWRKAGQWIDPEDYLKGRS